MPALCWLQEQNSPALAGWPRRESVNRSQGVVVPTAPVTDRSASLRCDVSAGWDASHAETRWQHRVLAASVRTDTGSVAGPGLGTAERSKGGG